MDRSVEKSELSAEQAVTAQCGGHGGRGFLNDERQGDVDAHQGQEENPGHHGDDVGSSHRLQDVSPQRMDDLQVPGGERR